MRKIYVSQHCLNWWLWSTSRILTPTCRPKSSARRSILNDHVMFMGNPSEQELVEHIATFTTPSE